MPHSWFYVLPFLFSLPAQLCTAVTLFLEFVVFYARFSQNRFVSHSLKITSLFWSWGTLSASSETLTLPCRCPRGASACQHRCNHTKSRCFVRRAVAVVALAFRCWMCISYTITYKSHEVEDLWATIWDIQYILQYFTNTISNYYYNSNYYPQYYCGNNIEMANAFFI